MSWRRSEADAQEKGAVLALRLSLSQTLPT